MRVRSFENRLRYIRERVRSFQRDWRNTANAFQLAYPHDYNTGRRNLPKIKQIYDAAKRWIAREQNASVESNWPPLQDDYTDLVVRLRFPVDPFTVYVNIRLRQEPRRMQIGATLVTPGSWWGFVESWSIIGSHVLLITELNETPWSRWSPTTEFDYITFTGRGSSRLYYNGSDMSLARSQRQLLARSPTLFPTGKRLPGPIITRPQDEFERETIESTTFQLY